MHTSSRSAQVGIRGKDTVYLQENDSLSTFQVRNNNSWSLSPRDIPLSIIHQGSGTFNDDIEWLESIPFDNFFRDILVVVAVACIKNPKAQIRLESERYNK
jgi:hypothetical protein